MDESSWSWSDRLAAWDAGVRRGQARWLHQLAEESGSLAGVALDLAEQGASGVVTLVGGAGRRAGVVTSVGADFLVVDSALIPFAAVASLQAAVAVAGNRSGGDGIAFAAALARLAGERPRVRVLLDGGESVVGDLAVVGTDVLRVDTTWVPMAGVRALVLV